MTPDDIRAIRQKYGWSPAMLGRVLGYRSNSTVGRIESGKEKMSASSVRLLTLLDECAATRVYCVDKWGAARPRGGPRGQ